LVLSLPWFVGIDRTWLNPESDRPPDPTLSCVRIIAFAFFLDGSGPKAANRGAQTFDRFVPNPERLP
jgi:hypothetical protein